MGFIPSLRTISIALKFLSGCLMIPGEDKPLPYVNYNVIDFFYCALIGLIPNPYMKLHHLLQKCSFFLIKLAAFQASGGAHMKH